MLQRKIKDHIVYKTTGGRSSFRNVRQSYSSGLADLFSYSCFFRFSVHGWNSDNIGSQGVPEELDSLDASDHFTIEPLPGLDTIMEELLKEEGYDYVLYLFFIFIS